ncbi:hypothetical protein SARC_00910 [Sphaeroforma arctica JP610]|uniref:15-hydroxyprostaglandin dehydrogenase n=1 Tax=Sphaeroforma arctica JP610 TaxID=667725 RepID=A0A0L0GDH4_9EUKA|nr:hypothetical protein SARC_00910 [Sphaeroforma arctica JP610]KNC86959.1 hypothetical protein SARC_00910 [Sphaeroforma arctica JP610]|eukprot:XP_014160861.1 hypothetical protein SARC_00910 [Sphaeroforma arctica JP610]
MLRNRVCLVTGGASGLGFKLVQRLIAANAKVCVMDKSYTDSLLHSQDAGEGLHLFEGDVTKPEDISEAIKTAEEYFNSPLQVMVNNAGIGDESDVARTININLKAVIDGTTLAVHKMQMEKVAGVIVNVASMGGIYPMPFAPVYAATKAGVIQYSRSVYERLESYNRAQKGKDQIIRVNTLCPSFAETPLLTHLKSSIPNGAKIVDALGRALTADEVADCFMTLIEDEQKNGAILRVTNHGVTYQNEKYFQ